MTLERGGWRVDRVVGAVDCGVAVNPMGIRAQTEGSVAWALSGLSTEVTLKGGRVEQSSFKEFPILRFRDMPKVETYIVASEAAPSEWANLPSPSRSQRSSTRSRRPRAVGCVAFRSSRTI